MGIAIPTYGGNSAALAKEDKRVNAANRPLYAGGGVIGTVAAAVTEAARNLTKGANLGEANPKP